jgi:hypothetical protein
MRRNSNSIALPSHLFRETYPFSTEKVYLSQIPGMVNMALYVSPIVSKVIRSRGGSTSEFTPDM